MTDPSLDAALSLTGVSHRYPLGNGTDRIVLQDVTLRVAPGELVTIMGPSGSGKSTLLGIAGGLEEPTAGTVSLSGTALGGLTAGQLATIRRRDVGFVFQRYNLVPLLTIVENVALPLELDGIGLAERTAAALAALATVNLGGAAHAFPDNLSGGEQQRVAIARAVVGTPRLILADEPTGALDSVSGEWVIRLIRERTDAGASAVVVTHDARLAAWADRTLYLADGVLSPDENTNQKNTDQKSTDQRVITP
jgi:putative ABC transport system ATP-binding protein